VRIVTRVVLWAALVCGLAAARPPAAFAQEGGAAQGGERTAADQGWFGVNIDNVTPEEAAALGLPKGKGVRILKSDEGGPADQAGLRAGDVLLVLEGKAIENTKTFISDLRARKPGAKVRVRFRRNGKTRDAVVALGKRPAEPEAGAPPPDRTAAEFYQISQLVFESQDPEERIVAAERALAIEPNVEPWPFPVPREHMRGHLWLMLGLAYQNRRDLDQPDDLEKAIAAYESALAAYPRDTAAESWAAAHSNLGMVFLRRIHGDRAGNIDRAISAFEAVLTVRTREAMPEKWAETQVNLGNTYAGRIRGDLAVNVEKAIAHLEAALTVHTPEASPFVFAAIQNSLGVAYGNRIRGDRADSIEKAISAFEVALAVHTRESAPQDWAAAQSNLGNAYLQRIRADKADNIEKAIAAYKGALTVTTREASPRDWAAGQASLGDAYANRLKGDRAENIEQAISTYEAALTVQTREASPHEWAGAQVSLGAAYEKRIHGEKADNIEKAIAAFEAALTVQTREALPTDWAATQTNLGITYGERILGERADNVEKAIAALDGAVGIFTREALTRAHLRAARWLGHMLLEKQDWASAARAFASARAAFLDLFGQGLDETEARTLIEVADALFSEAAYAAAQMGDAEGAFSLAAEGKARMLSVALRLQTLDLPPGQRARLEDIRAQIREQDRRIEVAAGEQRAAALDAVAKLRGELLALVQQGEAKSAPGGALALARSVLPEGGALVAPIVTGAGGKILVAAAAKGSPALTVLDLPDLTTDRVEKLLRGAAKDDSGGWLGAYNINYLPKDEFRARRAEWLSAIGGVGSKLWSLFADKLDAALKEQGVSEGAQVLWLPTGALGVLPLALAEDPATRRRLGETYDIAAAPSLSALATAKAGIAATIQAGPPRSLAAVVNPTGDLAFTEVEGALVASHFGGEAARFDRTTATPEAVLAGLRGKSAWHFSTHGFFDWANARNSGLLMKDKAPLTVGQLLDAGDLGHPRLVVLSACETGLYDTRRNPDEFTGLPAAFMALGASGVLSTLWPVDDRATALLIAKFYDLHLDDGLAPAKALRAAQDWLRAATRAGLIAYANAAGAKGRIDTAQLAKLESSLARGAPEDARFLDLWEAIQETVTAAAKAADDIAKRWADPGPDPNGRPFAHPYYWGGFTYTGL